MVNLANRTAWILSLLAVASCQQANTEIMPMSGPQDAIRNDPVNSARTKPTSRKGPNYAAHMAKLKRKLAKIAPNAKFYMVKQPPFVVVGDESMAAVKRRARGTVEWCTKLLKKAYFSKDPDHIIDVWLFRNRGSYMKHTKLIFNDNPGTPFGYYSPHHRALIMNIATGGGTLCHEIVHPFVAANFPNCPDWLNEGLGSLYEQCRETDGKIMGLTNWRLPILQKAIGKDKVPSFEDLTGTTRNEFYTKDRGTNYAQARYLCYYLQEKGLLRKFYKRFHADRKQDPTGYRTLTATLGKKPDEMAKWQKDWESWVMELRYR